MKIINFAETDSLVSQYMMVTKKFRPQLALVQQIAG